MSSGEIKAGPDVVQAIKDSVETKVIEMGGRQFTTRPVYEMPQERDERTPDAITVTTLSGLIQFIGAYERRTDIHFIHVQSPLQVNVFGKITGPQKERPNLAAAIVSREITRTSFRFNTYMPVEDFIIGVQTGFSDRGDRPTVLALIGNLKDESVRNVSDDGVTQAVTVRQGISLAAEARVPNPVSLAPYRTFAEVEQPLTSFILRVQRGSKEGQLPTVGLFETNDGQWEIAAIQRIQDLIEEEIKDIPVIA